MSVLIPRRLRRTDSSPKRSIYRAGAILRHGQQKLTKSRYNSVSSVPDTISARARRYDINAIATRKRGKNRRTTRSYRVAREGNVDTAGATWRLAKMPRRPCHCDAKFYAGVPSTIQRRPPNTSPARLHTAPYIRA